MGAAQLASEWDGEGVGLASGGGGTGANCNGGSNVGKVRWCFQGEWREAMELNVCGGPTRNIIFGESTNQYSSLHVVENSLETPLLETPKLYNLG